MTKERKLKPKQKKFLKVLFNEAGGKIRTAMDMAGYSKNTTIHDVVAPLANEIAEETKKYLAYMAPEAATAITGVLSEPTALGTKDKIAAAKDILDRANVKPTEKVEVSAASPLFILPEKKKS